MTATRAAVPWIRGADVAALIRVALDEVFKRPYPNVQFSVRTKSGNTWTSIYVKWTDGPSDALVREVVAPFNPETREYKGKAVRFGVDYVHTNRRFSHYFATAIAERVAKKYERPVPKVVEGGIEISAWWEDDGERIVGNFTLAELCWQEANKTPADSTMRLVERPEAPPPSSSTPPEAAACDELVAYEYEPSGDWTWLKFTAKPPEATRRALSEVLGFRWSSKRSAWYCTEVRTVDQVHDALGYRASNVPAREVEQPSLFDLDEAAPVKVEAPAAASVARPPRVDLEAERGKRAAANLRSTVATIDKEIERKRGSSLYSARPTRKRMSELAGLEKDVENLQKLKALLLGLATAFEANTVPPILRKVTSKAMVEGFRWREQWPHWPEDQKPLIQAGIHSGNYTEARQALFALSLTPELEDPRVKEIRELERGLVGTGIPGFFPTPPAGVERLLYEADIEDGHLVLEPSAGKGDIAEAIRRHHPGAQLQVIEWNWSLRRILELKGFELVSSDFLEYEAPARYDRIVANPPFEKSPKHVEAMLRACKPGGRIVTILGLSQAENKYLEQLQAKADEMGTFTVDEERLDRDLFLSSFVPTGTATRLVVINLDEEFKAW